MEAARGKKKMLATLVGCNYAGVPGINELEGCINDVHTMHDILLEHFGFAPGDITVLTDDNHGPKAVRPTRVAIMNALNRMLEHAVAGDVLFFHYSGHGTNDAKDGHGKDAIVPYDINFITDMDFQELIARVPAGATFTMVADSCFSGGLFDQQKEQIGPHNGATADRRLLRTSAPGGRFLPYETALAHLSAASGLDSHHIGDHLVALFGDDASPKFRPHHHHNHHHGNGSGGDAHAGILLSGCQADELSSDLRPPGKPACGAFTDSLKTVLAAHPAPMSNRELVRGSRVEVRRALEAIDQTCDQHPCLYCSDANADAPFLGQQDTKAKKSNVPSKEEKAAVAVRMIL